MHGSTGLAKFCYSRSEIGAANAVIERYALHGSARRLAAVAAFAEKLTRVGEKRCLTDAAGDKAEVLNGLQIRKSVTQRTPYLDGIRLAQSSQQTRKLADHQIADFDGGRVAIIIEDRVEQGERPSQQRVCCSRHADHEKLPGPNRLRQLRHVQA